MAGRGLLNLTLDEIIKQQNQEKRLQFPNTYRTDGRRNFSRNLSSSLSSRLSRGVGGGFIPRADTRINRNFSRVPGYGIQNKPIYKRLTRNTPLQRTNNALFRGKATTNLKTRNAEDYHPVRINNGAIVKGLRSDQLLLQKINQAKNKYLQEKIERVRALQAKKAKLEERRERSTWKSPSKVLMDVDHGLTVSFPNETIRKKPKPLMRTRRIPLSPPESPSSSSSSSSSEDDYSPQSTFRRVSTEAPPKDPLSTILRLGAERPPPPKPHRQVLDPTVQKEIAALQGYDEPHSVGPGPGVKGFKMMPSRTKTSLNERFTIERQVND